ncbi:MAG: ribosome-associated translation inhibitor RaiA [Candidatus Caenarcaniphilales bacterium]|nr:ribosome-associated translation inhibitor RaiA [Candidatus Caenarcaniphilales bacterium]
MDIQIDARHFNLTDAIRAYIEEKASILSETGAISAHYVLSVEASHTPSQSFEAELVLSVPGENIIVKDRADDLYKAIDHITSKALQISRKHKHKVIDKHQSG